ncbi:MAG: peptidoglycan editing factor PgeF [Candidatus Latescibacterota bacterium]|nr:MAG: peptidoglycan editing factor PgeF [Candidatus Latescibacterota bacterium]
MVEHGLLGIRFFTYEIFDTYRNVTNVVTSRHRGRSKPPYASFNLAFHVGDDPNAVLDNRATAAQLLGFEPEEFTIARQVHGTNVAVVGSRDRGRGAVVEDDAWPDTDAMITRAPDTPLAVLVADCVAVSLFDPSHNAVAIAHAGWAGTCKRIVQKTIQKMTEHFDTRPAELVAGVSPSIGACHYPIGQDVVDAFDTEFGPIHTGEFIDIQNDGQATLDLWACNRGQLIDAGVREDNIEVAGVCTVCQNDLFFSHRAEAGQTGRFAGIIMLNSSSPRAY